MKLNVSAKELLALHNLLHERCERVRLYDMSDEDVPVADDNKEIQLRQLYNRIKACIVAALMNRPSDPVDAFLNHEQQKIDKLVDQNAAIKKEQTHLVEMSPDFFVPVPNEDYTVPDYPRRAGQRNRGGSRGGNKR